MPTCIFLKYTFPLTSTNMTKTQILDFSFGKKKLALTTFNLTFKQMGCI
jgi:hypothetical protein